MESLHHLLILTVLMAATLSNAGGFSVKKRSLDEAKEKSPLADAMKVIQRAKRRAQFDQLARGAWPWDVRPYSTQAFDPEDSPYGRQAYDSEDTPDLASLFSDYKYDDDDDADAALYGPMRFWPEVGGGEEFGAGGEDDDRGDDDDDDEEVSDEELEDMFGGRDGAEETKRADGDEKGSLTEALLGPAATGVKTKQDAKRGGAGQDDVRLSELSPDEIDHLIQSVQDAEDDALDGSSSEAAGVGGDADGGSDGDHVTQEELSEIFGDDGGSRNEAEGESKDEAEEDDADGDDGDGGEAEDGNDSGQLNKEWLIAQYLNGLDDSSDVMTTKRKRSGERSFLAPLESDAGRYGSADSRDDLETELAIAREDIKVLKTFIDKEDEENANLAYALNLATKSQTDRTDRYVDEEIEYIKRAIRNELDIQEVKDVLHIAASLDGPASSDLEAASGGERPSDGSLSVGDLRSLLEQSKRADPELETPDEVDVPDDGDGVVDSDVAGDDANGQAAGVSDADLVRLLLASKLQKLLSQESGNDLRDPEVFTGDSQDWYDRPVLPSVEDVDSEPDLHLNPILRQLWRKYQDSSPERKRASSALSYPEPDESSELPIDLNTLKEVLALSLSRGAPSGEGTCPAVEELSSYCSFVSDLGLALDDEAVQLCNRHEVCYICGSASYIGLTADDCDRRYLEEAARLCEDKKGCDVDASRLFILMLRYHRYVQTPAPPQCAELCTQEYIAGSVYDE